MKNRIRVRLAELEMTQSDLADALKKDKAFVSRIVNNAVDIKLKTAFTIANVLECKIEDIFINE